MTESHRVKELPVSSQPVRCEMRLGLWYLSLSFYLLNKATKLSLHQRMRNPKKIREKIDKLLDCCSLLFLGKLE